MKTFVITPLQGYETEIGNWLWSFQDARQRTLNALQGLGGRTLDWAASDEANSIGTLLYHLAAVEMSWLYEDVLAGAPFPAEINALMKYDVREQDGVLTPVTGETLEVHLDRLSKCRENFLSAFQGMSVEDFRRPRKLDDYEVTPQWVIHHLMQHEAEHRGQIGEIRRMAEGTTQGAG